MDRHKMCCDHVFLTNTLLTYFTEYSLVCVYTNLLYLDAKGTFKKLFFFPRLYHKESKGRLFFTYKRHQYMYHERWRFEINSIFKTLRIFKFSGGFRSKTFSSHDRSWISHSFYLSTDFVEPNTVLDYLRTLSWPESSVKYQTYCMTKERLFKTVDYSTNTHLQVCDGTKF